MWNASIGRIMCGNTNQRCQSKMVLVKDCFPISLCKVLLALTELN